MRIFLRMSTSSAARATRLLQLYLKLTLNLINLKELTTSRAELLYSRSDYSSTIDYHVRAQAYYDRTC